MTFSLFFSLLGVVESCIPPDALPRPSSDLILNTFSGVPRRALVFQTALMRCVTELVVALGVSVGCLFPCMGNAVFQAQTRLDRIL